MKPVRIANLNYRLTTAEILYHLPDHPHVLQSFVWQQMDLAPDFPALHRFLTHWRTAIVAKLHSVTVAETPLLSHADLRHASVSLQLH
ncbi:MAG TPA: aspartate-semialdehyde dehydrogenase [Xanthobacteraceae bacterium]|nr:aspartate-semialdehyde dehydrogenase [Xanthobacteraceae bacterium]